MRKNAVLIARVIAARAGWFLAISVVLAVSFSLVFSAAVSVFSRLAESEHPGSLETPLSAAGPMLAGGVAAILLHIAVLTVLAWRRVPLTKFFLLLISVGFVSLIGIWYINLGCLRYTQGWFPVLLAPARNYPLLVVTPDQASGRNVARVILWSELEKFGRENSDYSFLVPEGQDSDLLSKLPKHDFVWAAIQKAKPEELLAARFEVTRLASGRQQIIVRGSWMRDDNASVESWYEADARRVYPKYFIEADTWTYYMLAVVLLVGSLDMALLVFYLLRQLKKLQSQIDLKGPSDISVERLA